MNSTTYQLIWLKQLLKELKFGDSTLMTLIYIRCFMKGPGTLRQIAIMLKRRLYQGTSQLALADVFTEFKRGPTISYISYKFGAL